MVENSTADVVVIGGGIVGCTAAYYLARRGASVILCEKGDVGLVIASGFSGHGFGMGPVVGKLVSELIVDAIPSIDLSALRLSRFKKGRKTKASPVV